ncbi:MAG: hypothetical protein Q8O38_16920 [Sulfurimicrobium sp.]|nr:hypothetical protein [Sulfurimicrobium sp.]
MPSTQRYLANNRNTLVGAVLTATSVATIEAAVLERPRARNGSARVALSGAYTGHEEAEYEIEITDTTVALPLISQPIFSGAGTGAISGIAFTGTAQTVTVKLADLGQVLTAAGTDMEGVSIVARNPGANGNLIHLTVNQSGLIFTASDFSLIQPLKAGADEEGPQFDWNTKVMGADNQIPADAHRLTFGEDTSTVYRQYKAYKDGKWLYHFEPAIQAEVPAGTRVKFVTGSRSITLTDGAITETYTGIVSLYDLLSAILTTSALVKVDGVVANDRAPGGMAARDLVTRTDAHILPSTGSGSAFARGFDAAYAGTNASTELVEARCWAATSKDHVNAGIGNEIWALKGSVSGDLGNIKSGIPFAESTGKFGFTIPLKTPDGFGQARGRFSVSGVQYAARDAGIEPPPICMASLALGPEASDQSITLKYKKRPDGACDCSTMSAPDLSAAFCLTGQIGGTSTMAYSPSALVRLTSMYDWGADTVKANSAYVSGVGTPEPFIPDLLAALRDFETNLAAVEGNAVAEANWDTVLAEFKVEIETEMEAYTAAASAKTGVTSEVAAELIPSSSFVRMQQQPDLSWAVVKASPYRLSHEKYDIGYVATGGAELSAVSVQWTGVLANFGALIPNNIHGVKMVYQIDMLSYPYPLVPVPVQLVDMSVNTASSAVQIGYGDAAGFLQMTLNGSASAATTKQGISIIKQRYQSRLNWVLITAGISPMGKLDAGTVAGGDGCWRDIGDLFYWEVVGGRGKYADAFSNTPYFSSQEVPGIPGAIRSTHEFAFQINIKCTAGLMVGDQITLSIGDAGWPSTYQVGDTLYLPVIAAQDLYLAGGKNGDNIQTWHVDGSVSGAFPAYALDLDIPLPYNQSGLQFGITPGGIPFEAGDLYQFAIEGGHYKWRKDAGAWSLPSPVGGGGAGGEGLSDGLSAFFATSAAPSFAAGDLYRFRALQPSALTNVIKPDVEAWRWAGSSATLTANLGAGKTIDCVSLAFHTLPSGATVTMSGGMDGVVWDWSESLTWRPGVMAKLFADKTASWLKLVIASATGGTIGWAWAGQALATENHAECQLRRDYSVERGTGLNPSAAYLGSTRSGEIEWQQGILKDADMTGLLAMLDHLKTNDDEPMILIPQSTRPEEAWPVRVLLDEIDMPEDGGYQPNTGNERRYGMKLSVKGVVA